MDALRLLHGTVFPSVRIGAPQRTVCLVGLMGKNNVAVEANSESAASSGR